MKATNPQNQNPVYKFGLYDGSSLVMETEVSAADPTLDQEFWEAFLEHGFTVKYHGEFPKEPEMPNVDHYTTMYHMESAGRRAVLLIHNGIGADFMVTCSENNVFKGWLQADDFDAVRQFGENFVMRRYSDE